MDGYSPFPVEGLAEAIGFHRSRVPLIVLIGGILGCLGGFFLQYWVAVIDYPINVGGTAVEQLAIFHSGHLRSDDSFSGAFGVFWRFGAQRFADALSSGF